MSITEGVLDISLDDARKAASDMQSAADEMKDLLDTIYNAMNDINDREAGIYQGDNRPAQLKEELDTFRNEFYRVYEQISISSQHLTEISNTAEAE